MVSSAMPKVVPPRANTSINMGMSRVSLPRSLATRAEMPRSMAPVLPTTPRNPPTMRIKAAMSMASYSPSRGAVNTEVMGCPCWGICS